MLRNQKGFAFPLSLSMIVIVSMFVVIHTEQYLIEKKIAYETEKILREEYYFLHSVRNLETKLLNGETITNSGGVILKDGRVDYLKEDLGATIKFTLTQTLSTGEKAVAFAYYDKNKKRMNKWVETN